MLNFHLLYNFLILIFLFLVSFNITYYLHTYNAAGQPIANQVILNSPVPTVEQTGGKIEATTAPSASPMPTATATPKPKPKVVFTTLPVGSTLPNDETCANRVMRSSFEPRPDNTRANHTKGTSGVVVDGASEEWNAKYSSRVNGNFTGTTDEIIQWGACKWGFEVDLVRAVAAQESWWSQSTVGDNGESFGLLQVRAPVHEGTYPRSVNSTAFNVDYALAWRRACFEGTFTWMKSKNPSYAAGDEWGCVGAWFSGNWYDGDTNVDHSGAKWYIQQVREYKNSKIWLSEDFRG